MGKKERGAYKNHFMDIVVTLILAENMNRTSLVSQVDGLELLINVTPTTLSLACLLHTLTKLLTHEHTHTHTHTHFSLTHHTCSLTHS